MVVKLCTNLRFFELQTNKKKKKIETISIFYFSKKFQFVESSKSQISNSLSIITNSDSIVFYSFKVHFLVLFVKFISRLRCAFVVELCCVPLAGGECITTDEMAASGKFDLSSSSPDRPLYQTVQRGTFMASSLDRSSSFRESMENPAPSAIPNISRIGSSVTREEAMNFFQCLRFDPKLVAMELKFHRQGDFKRFMTAGLGILPDDAPASSSMGKLLPHLSPEELKRVRASLRESSIKARERGKIFHDALSAFNKYFPSVPSKKRSRSDILSSQRAGVMLPGDRTISGPSAGKMGGARHTITTAVDHEQQKSEEWTKSLVPNKRMRTSLVDLKVESRANALARPSGVIERDRDILRAGNNGAVQGEDRTLPISVNGWEKSKMKKKRSGIKLDVSSTTTSAKPLDEYREPKQGVQPRLVTDTRARLNNDSHEFRPGIATVAVGTGKIGGALQHPSLGMRASVPRIDQENSSLLTDKRERLSGSDKERVNLRASNKSNARNSTSSSPTSSTKMNASARAPRSVSSGIPKSSPVLHRPATPTDWELSHSPNKPPAALVSNNRKRTTSARSSSPPVAQWAGQRPQKISRPARKTNFMPISPTEDVSPASDTIYDVAGENGSGSSRRMVSNSPQHIKVKGDQFSSAALSESEDSATVENKSIDKNKKSGELEEKSGQSVQKMSTLVLSIRKNKLDSGEDHGDGVRRQGRTGRNFTSTRSVGPMTVEKLGGVGTAKQLRTAKIGVENNESKTGRPLTRKLSDRKAYTRQKNTLVNAAAEFVVGSGDGHAELLAAVKAVISTTHAFSSSFWRKMETYFCLMSDTYITYLRQQVYVGSAAPSPLDVDSCGTTPNGNWLNRCQRDRSFASEERNAEAFSEKMAQDTRGHNDITLCQSLLAALISESEIEDICCSENEELMYGSSLELDADFEASSLHQSASGNFQIDVCAALNGYRENAPERSLDKQGHDKLEHNKESMTNRGSLLNFCHPQNGTLADQESVPSMICSEFQYDIMSIDTRILLEIQSIGIFPETVPDMTSSEDEDILEDIRRLEESQYCQGSKKKVLLGEVLQFTMEKREFQEKELEQCAIHKLVEMTYEKYMTFWGPNACSGKSSTTKIAKQASLAFVKRTVERCQEYEDTGKSCFNETAFRDMLLSVFSRLSDAQSTGTTDGVSSKINANTTSRASDSRVSASMGFQQSPSFSTRHGQNIDSPDVFSSNLLPPINYSSEQREGTWPNRVKKREVLLDDVGGNNSIGTSTVPSSFGNSLPSGTKGKRSERDRDGKGNTKLGRPSLSNNVEERKPKAKPKQRTTQLSASVNGILGKISEQPKTVLPSVLKSSEVATSGDSKDMDRFGFDLSHLQLPGMDDLGVPDDFNGDDQDLGSWLNIDDDVLADQDFMGLEIPMDDLSDLNMMV